MALRWRAHGSDLIARTAYGTWEINPGPRSAGGGWWLGFYSTMQAGRQNIGGRFATLGEAKEWASRSYATEKQLRSRDALVDVARLAVRTRARTRSR